MTKEPEKERKCSMKGGLNFGFNVDFETYEAYFSNPNGEDKVGAMKMQIS